jgi:hypothetical protein
MFQTNQCLQALQAVASIGSAHALRRNEAATIMQKYVDNAQSKAKGQVCGGLIDAPV